MATQLRSLGDQLHLVGDLTVANYALNPSFEIPDPTLLQNTRINLCTNPNFENGTTGWGTGGTVPPTISQSFKRSRTGTASLQALWGNGGSLPLVQGPAMPTTIGQTYTVSAYVYVPSGSPNVIVSLNDGGSLSGQSTLNNQWQRISQTFVATGTSCAVQFWPTSTPTGGGQKVYFDAVMYENASLRDYFDGTVDFSVARTNLCTNPSFETGTTGWNTGGGVPPTISTSTANKLFGTKSLQVNWQANGGLFPLISNSFTTVVGKEYTVSMFVKVPSGGSTVLLTVGGFSLAGQTSTLFDQWQRLSYTFIATSTSHQAQLIETNPVAGQVYVDGVLFEQTGALSNYFDGSLPPFKSQNITQMWTGTAHASTSTQSIPSSVTAWTGTANASTSTRNDESPMYWTTTNAIVTCDPPVRENGLYSAKVVPTITSAQPKLTQTFTVIDSTNYSISFHVYIPANITAGGISLEFDSFDVTNTLIEQDVIPLLQNGNQTLGFIRLATTFTTPAGTNTMNISVTTPNLPALTDLFYIDDFMVEQADTSSPDFIDGDMVGYCWSGVPGQSTTLQTEPSSSLKFFATSAYNPNPPVPADGDIPMGAQAQVLPTSWPFVPLTD